jgi:CubicO group peptidase (beta-lactamase class C family)
MSLRNYMKKYIWGPLGITNMTFHLEERPDMLPRLPNMTERQGGVNVFGTALNPAGALQFTSDTVWAMGMSDDSGGAGAYDSIVDYQMVLHSITAGDGKLLGA